MAVTFNRQLGGWQVDGRGFYPTQEAAQADAGVSAEASVLNTGPSSSQFSNAMMLEPLALAPKAPVDPNETPNPANPGGMSNNAIARRRAEIAAKAVTTANANVSRDMTGGATYDPAARAAAFNNGNVGGAAGAYNAGNATDRAHWDATHQDDTPTDFFDSTTGRVMTAVGTGGMSELGRAVGSVTGPVGRLAVDPIGYGTQLGFQGANILSGSGDTATPAPNRRDMTVSGGGGGAPQGTTADQLAGAEQDTNEAERDWRDTEADNSTENENLWSNLWEQYDKVGDADYGLSDEARGYQREGLQQQRMLLERMLGFDPNQYATQFADQALARTIAAGRSGPGGFAAQQAGMFAANEQAPALYAEGARTAAGLENQRLQAAAGVAKSFGELGTMTRGQDETRAQFDATLPLELAKAMTNATQGQVAMNEQESQRFADVYMNFAQLQATYAGMSSTEQIAWWDREMTDKGLDQQWRMFKDELAAQGKITAKDILGGVFSLGGAAITGGGSILAARAGRPGG
jgi:hypothetical protein